MIDNFCLSLRQLARADSDKFALAARVVIKLYGGTLNSPHTSNFSEFPDIMNKYFSSIGHNLASKLPYPNKQFHEYLPKIGMADSFFFNPVSYREIETDIMNIQLDKAHGLYSFPIRILKSGKHIISL